ncbi:hypothetical protein DEU56DRAFT_766573 [Suillus clintonianus]|uniref:uncharacterized protein n=1 Tax=Suillus clintonianus TaxID=1904413 RepID=UPI001B86F5F8|nr:uncharacterized protein DEU56DRAFT_766573 [Suillus clintonianus]KAG2156337.1 hypothetical protein DEU56DRAFT_766573 [Suillus clintonianus]
MNSSINHQHQFRRTHKKRSSFSRLSSDTVQTLPEYSAPLNWSSKTFSSALSEGTESDRPPDYPDSEEADTEEQAVAYAPQRFHPNLPRRTAPYTRRRKRQSVTLPAADPFLDALLERSVHALEMSNALMQSSISTQSSLSTLLSSDIGPDRSLEVRARNLSTRIRLNSGVHGTWMAHLEEISKGVDGLFDEEVRDISPVKPDEAAISQSLPTSNIRDLRNRRRPSLLELNGSSSSSSQLQFSLPKRDLLVAPAPRALTQYVESTADPCMITLPSTLGLRASASSHSADWQDHTFVTQQELRFSQSLPVLSGQPQEVPTPAYNLLCNIVKRSESATPPPTDTSSPRAFISRRGSTSTCSTERGSKPSACSVRRQQASPDRSRNRKPESASRSRSTTPRQPVTPLPRAMTPPIEELSASSSDSSDLPTGYRTVQSLRKILDEQPSSTSVNSPPRKHPKHTRSPNFIVTPAPAPVAGTSTATASISRLFTKGRHSSSTRPPSPPTHSSLKVPSVPPTPRSSPSIGSLSDMFGNGVAKVLGSDPPSGVSTPKRISFAELPESYASSRTGPSKIKEKRKNRSRKRKGKDEEEGEALGWFERLFIVGPVSTCSARIDERLEERMSRGWGTRPGGGTLDDWAV